MLSAADKEDLWAELQSELSAERVELPAIVKLDLSAAIDAVDLWLDTEQAGFVAAIPEPFRSLTTAKMKARLLMRVLRKRYEVT